MKYMCVCVCVAIYSIYVYNHNIFNRNRNSSGILFANLIGRTRRMRIALSLALSLSPSYVRPKRRCRQRISRRRVRRLVTR